MTLRSTRIRLGATVVAAFAAGALALSASPASAAASDGYVKGGGAFADDFGDEGVLSTTSYRTSSATCFWQQILWAEGATERDGTAFDQADMDGDFGPNTDHATRNLQSRWNVGVDGEVGPQTFGVADSKLRFVSGSTASGEYLRLRYDGASHDLDLLRTDDGRYIFYFSNGDDATGAPRFANYTLNVC
jgi:hypothetical protein